MTDLRTAAQQALEALEKYRQMMFAEAGCRWGAGDAAIAALRAALAQEQAEPEGSVCARCGALAFDPVVPQAEPLNLSDRAVQRRLAAQWGYVPAQEQAVTDDMRSAVRWAPSSAYWSERLREFFGPDAREGIDALERRLAEAQEPKGSGNLPPPLQAEPDLSRCPQCNGPADNGHDRSIPPSPYLCTSCMAEPVQEPVAWMHPHKPDQIRLSPQDGWLPLVIAPPPRTMVPLTEREIEHIHLYLSSTVGSSYKTVARAIEKASWEKNHG